MAEKTIYLIDGSAYIHRAYHAVRALSNSSGLPTNAVFGFTRMLMKLIEDRAPEYMGVFFDAKGPTFRHDIYPDYKANRSAMPEDLALQIPYVKEVTRGFRIPAIEKQGFEADDLIGTYARLAQKAGFSVIIATGDKDFMQLVNESVEIWDPMKEKTIDVDEVRKILGADPGQVIDIMGLAGDSADNIPGAPGIGPKTASSLIRTFGSLEGLYDRIHEVTQKKRHENLVKFKDQVFLSRRLAEIDTHMDMDFDPGAFRLSGPDKSALGDLFRRLEFRRLQNEFPQKSDLSGKTYKSVMDPESLARLTGRLSACDLFAMDTETTSKDPMRAEIVGFSFAMEPDEAFYIPCGHDYEGAPAQLSLEDVLKTLKPVLEDPGIKKIGQNIKYDWMVLARRGVEPAGVFFDTMLASYLLNPSRRSHSLDAIALEFLDHKTITYNEAIGKKKGQKGKSCFSEVELETAVPYACEDADITLSAFWTLTPKLSENGLDALMEDVEMPLVPTLKKMEMTGIRVDEKSLKAMSASFQKRLETLEEKIHGLAGEEFNVKSSQQLGHILFEKLELPVLKKTRKKTAYSTDANVLAELSLYHELPGLALRHRALSKLKSTYADSLIGLIHPETGRIHTSFNQTVTVTGRLSSSDPNLQNIPARTEEGREIRAAFIPDRGMTFISADYSQIELRILAHCSEDESLVESFLNGEDIHAQTAREILKAPPSVDSGEIRRRAKAINFGIVYGISAFGLSRQLGIPVKTADAYIQGYFDRRRGVKRYFDRIIAEARKSKKTFTLMNRARFLPDIDSPNARMRKFAERAAMNTPIQGTAADLIKLAMIRMDRELTQRGLKTAMLLSVHDELLFESPLEEEEEVKKLATDVMESIWDLKVPLEVNVRSGKNWSEAH
ncbi:DNA polymerase I [Candidatus Desulfarcum epimagneticum]|uniref:DNA polymerase I n=1 Tax=uncultured Desulfobacteraceae bacterium TaxID=218296 RepID=A0A484HR94_9BACT|nr:DNA polymerase I [uncultured Desulfobacteraceae bacterium]